MKDNRWMIALAASLIGLALIAVAAPHLHPEPRIQYATAAPW